MHASKPTRLLGFRLQARAFQALPNLPKDGEGAGPIWLNVWTPALIESETLCMNKEIDSLRPSVQQPLCNLSSALPRRRSCQSKAGTHHEDFTYPPRAKINARHYWQLRRLASCIGVPLWSPNEAIVDAYNTNASVRGSTRERGRAITNRAREWLPFPDSWDILKPRDPDGEGELDMICDIRIRKNKADKSTM